MWRIPLLPLILSTNELLGNNLDKNAVGGMIKSLLPRVIQSFKIEHKSDLTFPVICKSRPGHYFDLDIPDRGAIRISPKLVVKLIKVANSTNTDTKGIMSVLLRYSNNVRGSAADSAFHEFLYPVAATICELIAQTKQPPTADEKGFITELLNSYINCYVKNARTPPADWITKTTIRCACSDCLSLSQFIDNEDKKTLDFAMAEKRRKHLEQQLDRSFYLANCQRSLAVQITCRKDECYACFAYKAWLKRVHVAKFVLKQLSDKGPLNEILGESTYLSIFEHTNLQIPEDNPPSSATTTNARPTVQSTVPQKRSWFG